MATLPAVQTTLQKIKEQIEKATGILYGITELKFVVCLVVYKIFGISARLSDLLQAKSIEIGSAVTVIKVLSAEFYFHKPITLHLELYLFYCFINFVLYIGQY